MCLFKHDAYQKGTGCVRGITHIYAVESDVDLWGEHVIVLPHSKPAALSVKPNFARKTQPQTQSPLFRLPPEIRLMIWRELAGDGILPYTVGLYSVHSRITGPDDVWTPRRLSIAREWGSYNNTSAGSQVRGGSRRHSYNYLRGPDVLLSPDRWERLDLASMVTCRLAYRELTEVMFGTNTFYSQSLTSFRLLPAFIPLESLQLIRDVHIKLDVSESLADKEVWLTLIEHIRSTHPQLNRLTLEVGTWSWAPFEKFHHRVPQDWRGGWVKAPPSWSAQIEAAMHAAFASSPCTIKDIRFILGWPECIPAQGNSTKPGSPKTLRSSRVSVSCIDNHPPLTLERNSYGYITSLKLGSGRTIPWHLTNRIEVRLKAHTAAEMEGLFDIFTRALVLETGPEMTTGGKVEIRRYGLKDASRCCTECAKCMLGTCLLTVFCLGCFWNCSPCCAAFYLGLCWKSTRR